MKDFFITLYKFCRKNWPILILIIVPILFVAGWYQDGTYFAYGDDFGYVKNYKNYDTLSTTWFDKTNLGIPNINVCRLFPIVSFMTLFHKFGIADHMIQLFWALFLWIPPGISFYILIRYLFRNAFSPSKLQLLAFSSAFLYLFNPITVENPLQVNVMPIFAWGPVFIYFFIRGLNEPKQNFLWGSLASLTSLFFASSGVNYPTLLPPMIFLVGYCILIITQNPTVWFQTLKYIFLTAGIILLFHIWWIIPFILGSLSTFHSTILSLTILINRSSLVEVIRGLGKWYFNATQDNVQSIQYALSYYSPIILITTYIVPIIIFCSFLILKNKHKNVRFLTIFFMIMYISALALSKGNTGFFGKLFESAFNYIPVFKAFREPLGKFGPLIFIFGAPLFGLGIISLFDFSKRPILTRYLLSYAAVFTICCIIAFPFFTGLWINKLNTVEKKPAFIKVPEYWERASEYISNLTDSKSSILILPRTGYMAKYDWQYGAVGAGNAAVTLLDSPVIIDSFYTQNSPLNQIIDTLYWSVDNQNVYNENTFERLNAILGVRYILLENDVDSTANGASNYSPQNLVNLLDARPSIKRIAQFEKLILYETNTEFQSPRIFTSSDIPLFDGNSEGIYFEIIGKANLGSPFFNLPTNEASRFISKNTWEEPPILVNLNKDECNSKNWNIEKNKLSASLNKNKKENLVSCSFEVSRENDYLLLIEAIVHDKNPALKFSVDGKEIRNDFKILPNEKTGIEKFRKTYERKQIILVNSNTYLSKGDHTLDIEATIDKGIKGNQTVDIQRIGFLPQTDKKNEIEINPIDFIKINPSKYQFKLSGIKKPFYLNFLEAYNKNWEISINGEEVDPNNHFALNGITNSWYIDEIGDLNLVIEFGYQKYLKVAIFVSAISIICVITLIIISQIWKKSKK